LTNKSKSHDCISFATVTDKKEKLNARNRNESHVWRAKIQGTIQKTVTKEEPKTSGKKSINLLISSNDSSEKDSIEDNSYKSGNNRDDDKGRTQEGENEVEESTKRPVLSR